MTVIQVEVYYGYYAGEARLWDTIFVSLPIDTPEDKIEKLAVEKFYRDFSSNGHAGGVMFTGAFPWEYVDTESDDYICDEDENFEDGDND